MSESEFKIIQLAANIGGYLVMCFYLIWAVKALVAEFLDRLIRAIQDNTAARVKDAEEKGRLSEKIDAMAKGSGR